jgi:hypothetical protein
MKKNLKWYPHTTDSHNDSRHKLLRGRYGWDGEGKYYALKNIIGQSDNCYLDLSKKYIRADVAEILGFTLIEFDQFIKYLGEECELLIIKGKLVTIEDLKEILPSVMNEREAARLRKNKKKGSSPELLTNKKEVHPNFPNFPEVHPNSNDFTVNSDVNDIDTTLQYNTIDNNKETTTTSSDLIFTLFNKWNETPKNGQFDFVNKLITNYGTEEINIAFDLATKAGKFNLSYVEGILKKRDDTRKNNAMEASARKNVNEAKKLKKEIWPPGMLTKQLKSEEAKEKSFHKEKTK